MLGKPVFDRDVLTSNIPSFDQASAKPRQQMWSVTRREPIQEPNHRHRWLLRACRERPCCRAAQQRDNLPSSDHSMAPARELRSIISDWRRFGQGLAAARDFEPPDVWLGSFTSLWLLRPTVRMSASHPKATESLRSSEMTLSAMSGREQMQQTTRSHNAYSITSSAVESSVGGTVRPSILAV